MPQFGPFGARIPLDLRTQDPGQSTAGVSVTNTLTFTITSTCTPTFVKSVAMTRTVTGTSTSTVVKQVGKVLTITSTPTRTFVKQVGQPRAVTATTTSSFIKSVGLIRSVTATTTSSFLKLVGKVFTKTATTTSTFVKSVGKIFTVTSTTTNTALILRAKALLFTTTVNASIYDDTPVLDSFNSGASQNLSARTGWAAGEYWSGEPTLVTDSVPTYATTAPDDAWRSNYRTGVLANSEVWITFGSTGSGVDRLYICSTRGTGETTAAVSDYELITQANGSTYQLERFDAGVSGGVLLSGTFPSTAVGDSVKLRSLDSVHTIWYRPAGTSRWLLQGTVTDATYASGVIALQMRSSGATLATDEFGGGALVPLFVKQVGITRTTTGAGTPTYIKSVGKPYSVTTTATKTFVKQVGLPRSTTATGTSSFLKQLAKNYSLTSTPTRTVSKQVGITRSATATGTPSFIKSVGKLLLKTVTGTATIVKQVGKFFLTTATGVVTYLFATCPIYPDTGLGPDTLLYPDGLCPPASSTALTFTVTASNVTTFVKKVSKTYTKTVTCSPTYARVFIHTMNFAVTANAVVTFLGTFVPAPALPGANSWFPFQARPSQDRTRYGPR